MAQLSLRIGIFSLALLFYIISVARVAEHISPSETESQILGPKKKTLIGDLKPTFYWVALEKADVKKKELPLYDINGNLLIMVTKSFFAGLSMEGTGRLLDGRLINFHARVDRPDGSKEVRWRWCDPNIAPFGYGLDDRVLKPFKSVAVDPSVIPMDSKIYIPAAIGARLPDGTKHNGYFDAIDIGSAIINQRIDIFTSFGDQSSVFTDVGMQSMRAVQVYLVE